MKDMTRVDENWENAAMQSLAHDLRFLVIDSVGSKCMTRQAPGWLTIGL